MNIIFKGIKKISSFVFESLNFSDESFSNGVNFIKSEDDAKKDKRNDGEVEEQDIKDQNDLFSICALDIIRIATSTYSFQLPNNSGLAPTHCVSVCNGFNQKK